MQDKILLGLLMEYEKLTSYDAQKIMEISTSYFYTTSLGSINPAFKKLLSEGNVDVVDKIENGRLKKVYSITEKGKETFFQWIKEDVGVSKIKFDLLLKVFFFPYIPDKEKKRILEVYLPKVKNHIKKLEDIIPICKEKNGENEQLDTLLFGIDYYKFLYSWFEKYKMRFDD